MSIEELLSHIDEKEIVKLLSDLVGISSDSSEQSVMEYIGRRLDKIGVDYEITEVDVGRQNLTAYTGDGEKSLILNSHMDTVPPGNVENWRTPPLELTRDGDTLLGLGSCDAKGSLAGMITAFELLARRSSMLNGRLILQAVCCEETQARGSLAEVKRGVTADAAIIGEPTSLVPMIGHKGGLRMYITVLGKAAHGSAPQEGINAISKMSLIIRELDALAEEIFQRRDPLFGNASLAVTKIDGGEAPNVIPDKCTIAIDRRLLPGETLDNAKNEVLAVIHRIKQSDPDLETSVELGIGINPCRISIDGPIVEVVKRSIAQVKGKGQEISGFTACCDMWCLVEGAGIPTMILGPGETTTAHKANEGISASELHEAAKIYTAIALNWLS